MEIENLKAELAAARTEHFAALEQFGAWRVRVRELMKVCYIGGGASLFFTVVNLPRLLLGL